MPFSSTTGFSSEGVGDFVRARRERSRQVAAVAALGSAVALLVATLAPPVAAGAAPQSSGLTEAKQTVAMYSGVAKPTPLPGPALNGVKLGALKGKTVLYVPFTLAGAPFLDSQASLKAALDDVGISMSTCDPNGVPSSVSTCLNNARADGASAIVTGDIPYNLAPDAYKAVEAEHIPTLASVAGPGNPPDSKYLAFQVDNQQTQTIGQVLADTAIVDSGDNGHILFISNTDSTSLEAQARATVATVKHECPRCQITNLPFSLANLTQLPTNVSSAMVNHPGVNFVLSQVDLLLPDVAQGLASSGNAHSIKQVGATGSLSTLQAMAKSSRPVVGDVGLDYDYAGWVAADGILRMLLGEPVPANPLIPLHIFTPSNIHSLSLTSTSNQNTWYGVSNIPKTFNQLWGVK
jgi:ribose transport system substrate-binding protein